jgi:hypothetical protein
MRERERERERGKPFFSERFVQSNSVEKVWGLLISEREGERAAYLCKPAFSN